MSDKIRLWEITFGEVGFASSRRIIRADNLKEAMNKALSKRNRTWVGQNLHSIMKIELIAETD